MITYHIIFDDTDPLHDLEIIHFVSHQWIYVALLSEFSLTDIVYKNTMTHLGIQIVTYIIINDDTTFHQHGKMKCLPRAPVIQRFMIRFKWKVLAQYIT